MEEPVLQLHLGPLHPLVGTQRVLLRLELGARVSDRAFRHPHDHRGEATAEEGGGRVDQPAEVAVPREPRYREVLEHHCMTLGGDHPVTVPLAD